MKFFYWTEADLTQPQSNLMTVDLTAGAAFPSPIYGPTIDHVAQLLSDGYTEISPRTAYTLGWPI